jgi:Flp pilus assembly protein TadG
MVIRHTVRRKRGQIVVMAPIVLAVLGAFCALTVDVGQMFWARAVLQNAADAASLAGAQVLSRERLGGASEATARAAALAEAGSIGRANAATAGFSVQFGTRAVGGAFVPADVGTAADAVHVSAYRTGSAPGGPVGLTFGRLLGVNSSNVSGAATAVASGQIRGMRGGLRPFVVYEGDLLPIGQTITFHEHDTIVPGVFGLLDLDGGANGTPELAQWIRCGYDGTLEVSAEGYIWIDGDPGWRAALKDDIKAIWGEEIYVVVYDQVNGSGANAHFRCIGFVGIVITDSRLTGNNKYIQGRVTGMKSVHDVIMGGSWTSPNLRKLQIVD